MPACIGFAAHFNDESKSLSCLLLEIFQIMLGAPIVRSTPKSPLTLLRREVGPDPLLRHRLLRHLPRRGSRLVALGSSSHLVLTLLFRYFCLSSPWSTRQGLQVRMPLSVGQFIIGDENTRGQNQWYRRLFRCIFRLVTRGCARCLLQGLATRRFAFARRSSICALRRPSSMFIPCTSS